MSNVLNARDREQLGIHGKGQAKNDVGNQQGKHSMMDNMQAIPGDMRSQMTDYQNNPDSLTARNALFQKWNAINPSAAQNFINQSATDAGNTQGYDTEEGMLSQIAQAYNVPANAFPVKRPENGGDLFGVQ